MGCVDGMYVVIFSIFAALILILLVVSIAVAFKIMETLRKVDEVIDDINHKSKKLDGVFDIVDSTSNAVSSISNKVVESIVGMIQNLIERKSKKED